MTAAAMIKVKRVYEPPDRRDGLRVLVDRLWPRGLSKDAAAVDRWMKRIAPSAALRKWFAHDPAKWEAFCARYTGELDRKPGEVAALRAWARTRTVTLVYGAKDTLHNNAVALKRYLDSHGTAKGAAGLTAASVPRRAAPGPRCARAR